MTVTRTDINLNAMGESDVAQETDNLLLHPSKKDMDMEMDVTSERIDPNGNSTLKSVPQPMAPKKISKTSSENPEIRQLQAAVEELAQQDVAKTSRLAWAEMKIAAQEREISVLKRHRLDSAGNSKATVKTSRSSSSNKTPRTPKGHICKIDLIDSIRLT